MLRKFIQYILVPFLLMQTIFIPNATANSVYEFSSNTTWTVPFTSQYKVEVWGASGGDTTYVRYSSNQVRDGGLGNYSTETITLTQGTQISIEVGQRGQSRSSATDSPCVFSSDESIRPSDANGGAGGAPDGGKGGNGSYTGFNSDYSRAEWSMGGAGGGGYSKFGEITAKGGSGASGWTCNGVSGGSGGAGGGTGGVSQTTHKGNGMVVVTMLNSPPSITLTVPTTQPYTSSANLSFTTSDPDAADTLTTTISAGSAAGGTQYNSGLSKTSSTKRGSETITFNTSTVPDNQLAWNSSTNRYERIVHVRATVSDGKGGTDTKNASFIVYKTNPNAPAGITSPSDNQWLKGGITTNATWQGISDWGTGSTRNYHVEFFNGTSTATYQTGTSTSQQLSLPSGGIITNASVKVKAVTNHGESSVLTRNFRIDGVAPTITSNLTSGSVFQQGVTPTFSATDTGSGVASVTATLKRNQEAPKSFASGGTIVQGGDYELNITATDNVGNVSTQRIIFSIIPPTPNIELMTVTEDTIKIRDMQDYQGQVERKFILIGVGESEWTSADEYFFQGLSPNQAYDVKVEVRYIN